MSSFRENLEKALSRARARGLERTLALPEGIDFCSNNYLGLAGHPELRERTLEKIRGETPLSSPASRLLRGHLAEHARLEERLARFKGTEAALLFSTGYQANLGLLTGLAGPRDRVLSDQLNHASIIDALRLCGARKKVFPHLDAAALREELARPHPGGQTIVVTESLFSMDGDIAPLDLYAELVEKYQAALIVDDAHATGVYGDARGSGLVEHFGIETRVDAVISTFGKALGLFGAFVAGPRLVIDSLVQRSRPFIFTTAPPPLLLHAIESSLELASAHPEWRRRVLRLADRLRHDLREAGLDCLQSAGPIVPVIVGENERAVKLGESLRARGYDVRGIRPPSVPRGTARLRISVHADHTEDESDGLRHAIVEEMAKI